MISQLQGWLVRSGGQQFGFCVSRMNELVPALARLALLCQNPVHCADRAMIPALVEERGVNGRRRAVLKSLLMKATPYRVPFRRIQPPARTAQRRLPPEKKPRTPFPKKKARGISSASQATPTIGINSPMPALTAASPSSGNGWPSSMATFF